MKKLSVVIAFCSVLVFAAFTSCTSQTSQAGDQTDPAVTQDDKIVTVIYFHGDRRCATCKAVGSVSKQAIADNFADNPGVVFKDVNIDEAENNEIKDKLEMSGSGLFIFDGKEKVDLTAIAFQKAVSDPDALSQKIVASVKEML